MLIRHSRDNYAQVLVFALGINLKLSISYCKNVLKSDITGFLPITGHHMHIHPTRQFNNQTENQLVRKPKKLGQFPPQMYGTNDEIV